MNIYTHWFVDIIIAGVYFGELKYSKLTHCMNSIREYVYMIEYYIVCSRVLYLVVPLNCTDPEQTQSCSA